jgi:hypothetical protein
MTSEFPQAANLWVQMKSQVFLRTVCELMVPTYARLHPYNVLPPSSTQIF